MNEVWIDGIKYVPELKINPIESDGWIPRTGTECPVHPNTELKLRLRDGDITIGPASKFVWKDAGCRSIVRYKIIKPYIEPKSEDNLDMDDVKVEQYVPQTKNKEQWVRPPAYGVKVTHIPTGLTASCEDSRSAYGNKPEALKKLAALVKAQSTEPKPKLIDWAMGGMEGCMTNYGKFISTIGNDEFTSLDYLRYWKKDLRLAPPKDHEGWQSALNFEDVDAVIKKLRTQCVVEVKIAPSISFGGNVQAIVAFRVMGLQAGYTDDPSLVGEVK